MSKKFKYGIMIAEKGLEPLKFQITWKSTSFNMNSKILI